MKLGKYLTLEEFCTCTQTYQKYKDQIDPFPQNTDSIIAIKELNQKIIDPIINHFGREQFCLTYGFCSKDLKKFLAQKDPITGIKNGRVDPKIDQHLSYELNKNGKYFCQRLGASCDFLIKNKPSNHSMGAFKASSKVEEPNFSSKNIHYFSTKIIRILSPCL
jgi:hypothetical protein